MTVSDDFIKGVFADFPSSVTRTPVTVTTNFSGNKTYTDGDTEVINVVFINPSQNYNLDKPGLTESADGVMFIKSTQTMNKYDKILFNSKTYRVETVSDRKMAAILGFKRITLFFI